MADPVQIDSIESLYREAARKKQTENTALLVLWLRSWLSQVSNFDPASGAALHTGLDEFCHSVSTLIGDESHQDYTQDRIYRIVSHSSESIIAIMGHAREKILREHAMLPIHNAKEVDSKSVQWLGRMPGRTIREKLAGKPYMKAVRRRSSVDTAENKLYKALLLRFGQVLDERQRALNVYSEDTSEKLLMATQRWLRTQEAADIGGWNNLPPNNILLQDKLYRKIWDAWLWLQGMNESIKADVARINKDALNVVFWETMALMNCSGYFRLVQQPILLDYDNFQIAPSSEVIGVFNPPPKSKFSGKIKTLDSRRNRGYLVSDSGTELPFQISNLEPNLDFKSLKVGDSVNFRIVRNNRGKQADGIMLTGNHEAATFLLKNNACELLIGEQVISLKIASQYLVIEQSGGNKIKYPLDSFNLSEAPKSILSMVLGPSHSELVSSPKILDHLHAENIVIDLISIRPNISGQVGNQMRLPFRFLLQQWPSLENGKSFVDCSLSKAIRLSSPIETMGMRTLIDPITELSDSVKSEVSMLFAKKLRDHIQTDMLMYLIPDWMNDFDTERIRKSINFNFSKSAPIPKSIAAAFAWQSSKTFAKSHVGQNDILLVVDSHPSGYAVTPLEARYKEDLKKILPGTFGFYWERHPTTTVEVSGINESIARFLSSDGCPHPEEIIRMFGFDGLKSDGGGLSILMNDEWYHIPEISQQLLDNGIDPFVVSEQSINGNINTIAGKLQASNVHVLTLDDAIKVPNSDRSYKVVKETLSIVEGGQILNQWQKEAGDIPLWRDHLPELSIRIVQHGHFEDFYLVKDAAVTPQRGSRVEIPVEESFTLPAGQNHYSFPLQQGEGNRELKYVAYLKSPVFPLANDTNCRLNMTYTYGADDPYDLKFIPIDGGKSGFNSVHVEWRVAHEAATIDPENLPVPDFPTRKDWSDFQRFPKEDGERFSDLLDWLAGDMEKICDNANFIAGADSKRIYDDQIGERWNWMEDKNGNQFCVLRYDFGEVFFHESHFDEFVPDAESISFNIEKQGNRNGYVAMNISLGKSISEKLAKHFSKSLRFPALTIWNQGHSILDENVPVDFRNILEKGIKSTLDLYLDNRVQESIKEQLFFFLCCLQKDAPQLVVDQLLYAVKDKELFRKHSWNIAYAIGEAELSWQQELLINVIKPIDNEGLTRSIAMEILAIAFWRSESLIRLMTENELVTLTQYTIGCLEFDTTKIISNGRGYHIIVLARHLELLLALLRSRGFADEDRKLILAPGTELAQKCLIIVDEISKVVIQQKLRIKSRINLQIEKPQMFAETPDLLYALRMYLTGDSGANTISVTSVSDE